MGKTVVDGILFDLDNTLLDRESAFLRVAEDFYEEHLLGTVDVVRAEAVAMLVHWDADGYVARGEMLEKWLAEWPGVGLDMDSVSRWYRSAMQQQVRSDAEVNRFLAWLNDRRLQ